MIFLFTDPILKGPTTCAMLMCFACALVGVIAFVRKESLLGETLSHSTYPGIMVAALIMCLSPAKSFILWGVFGALSTSLFSLLLLRYTKQSLKMKSDSALSFVLTFFFGLGLVFSSYLQNVNSSLYKQARVFLFGQTATIPDSYFMLCLGLAITALLLIFFFYKAIQIVNLDPIFSKTVGLNPFWVEMLSYFLLILVIGVGVRTIGLFLISGMLIGPAIAARQWTSKLSNMFIIAAGIGLLSGPLGIYISVKASEMTQGSLSFPSGPTILVVNAAIAFLSLIFAPKKGWAMRTLRIFRFKKRCNEENILKSLWHFKQKGQRVVTDQTVLAFQGISKIHFYLLTAYLNFKGELIKSSGKLSLTERGSLKAKRIVRMHRLWELYLVHIGVGKEKVHHNAEEMEHIITPEIEKQLLKLMKNPLYDPHNKPIPSGGT